MNTPIGEAIATLELIDHHVHGTLRVELDREAFESVMTESDRPRRAGTTNFDSQFGLAVRRFCAPLLGLEAHATPEAYVEQRLALGAREVNRRLLQAAGLGAMIIDTGFATATLTDLAETAELSGSPTFEIVRLEAVAEAIAAREVSPAAFGDAVRLALSEAVRNGAVGFKSIAAYRYGLDVPQLRPSDRDVELAVTSWYGEIAERGTIRISHPMLMSFLMWSAIDCNKPLQFHIGYGDSDINLLRAHPALLTDFMKATEGLGADIMLLHCYPYHRAAAYLSQMFPHVFFDIGEAINYTGLQSETIIRESLEIGPFTKQLYSSDGWGPAELHFIGAHLWRRGMTNVLSTWVERGDCTVEDALRVASLIGRENAIDVYGISVS